MRVECVLLHCSNVGSHEKTASSKIKAPTNSPPLDQLDLKKGSQEDSKSSLNPPSDNPLIKKTTSELDSNGNEINYKVKLNGALKPKAVECCRNHSTELSHVPISCREGHLQVPTSSGNTNKLGCSIRSPRTQHQSNNEMMTVDRHESFESLPKRQRLEVPQNETDYICYSDHTKTKKNEAVVPKLNGIISNCRIAHPQNNSANNECLPSDNIPISNGQDLVREPTSNITDHSLDQLSEHPLENVDETKKDLINNIPQSNSNHEKDQDILARACHAIGLDSALIDVSEVPEIPSLIVQPNQKLNDSSNNVQVTKPSAYYENHSIHRQPFFQREPSMYAPYPYGYKPNHPIYPQRHLNPYHSTGAQLSHSVTKTSQTGYHNFHSPQFPNCRMDSENTIIRNRSINMQEKHSNPVSSNIYPTPPSKIPYPYLNERQRFAQGFSYHISRYPPHGYPNPPPPRHFNPCRYPSSYNPGRNLVYSAGIYSPPRIQMLEPNVPNPRLQNYKNHISPHVVPQSHPSPQLKQRTEYAPISSPISPPLSPMVDVSFFNKAYDNGEYHHRNMSHVSPNQRPNYSMSGHENRATHGPAVNNCVNQVNDYVHLNSSNNHPLRPNGYHSTTNMRPPFPSNTFHTTRNIYMNSQQPYPTANVLPNVQPVATEETKLPWPGYSYNYRENSRQGRQRSNSLPSSEMLKNDDRDPHLQPARAKSSSFAPLSISSSPLNDTSLEPQLIRVYEKKNDANNVPKAEARSTDYDCSKVKENPNSFWYAPSTTVTQTLIPQRSSPNSSAQKSSCQYESSASMFMSISEESSDHISQPYSVPIPEITKDISNGSNSPTTSKNINRTPAYLERSFSFDLPNRQGSTYETSSSNTSCVPLHNLSSTHEPSKDDKVSSSQSSDNVPYSKVPSLKDHDACQKSALVNTVQECSPSVPFTSNSAPENLTQPTPSPSPSPKEKIEVSFAKQKESNEIVADYKESQKITSTISEPKCSTTGIKKFTTKAELKMLPFVDPKILQRNFEKEQSEISSTSRDSIVPFDKETNENKNNSILDESEEDTTFEENKEKDGSIDEINTASEICEEIVDSVDSTNFTQEDIKETENENLNTEKEIQDLNFKEKLVPVLDHLLNVPEAQALKHLKDKPEELLSHIVKLWGGESAQSKDQDMDQDQSIREDFMIMVKLLFKPQLIAKWGWDEAQPDQILDDLLKPSLDCGVFLKMNIRKLFSKVSKSSIGISLEKGCMYSPLNELRKILLKKEKVWSIAPSRPTESPPLAHSTKEATTNHLKAIKNTSPRQEDDAIRLNNADTETTKNTFNKNNIDYSENFEKSPFKTTKLKMENISLKRCHIVLERIDDTSPNL